MTEPPDRPLSPEAAPARGRTSSKQFVLIAIGIAVVVYFVLLVVENRRKVKVDYVVGSGEHRLIWLIVISGFLGWLFGIATMYLARRRRRRAR
jgi:uncharacterized integral membrane protein